MQVSMAMFRTFCINTKVIYVSSYSFPKTSFKASKGKCTANYYKFTTFRIFSKYYKYLLVTMVLSKLIECKNTPLQIFSAILKEIIEKESTYQCLKSTCKLQVRCYSSPNDGNEIWNRIINS